MNDVIGIIIDCSDVSVVAEFWRQALGAKEILAPSAHLASLEITLGGQAVGLTFRRVIAPKVIPNRIRLDLRTADLNRETDRLLSLGAIRIKNSTTEPGCATLADTEGNEFQVRCDRPVSPPTALPSTINLNDR